MTEILYLNGQYQNKEQTYISIDDRGFLYGHSVYESIPIYNGVPFLFEAHFQRLKDGLETLNIPFKLKEDELKAIIDDLWHKNNYRDRAKCYIQVTAGETCSRNYSTFHDSTCLIRLYDWQDVKSENRSAIIVEDQRWNLCGIKSNSLAFNAMSGHYAYKNNALEAIFSRDGYIQECTTSNIFIIKDEIGYTPSTDQQILIGATRNWVIEKSPSIGTKIIEKPINQDELFNADEVFITASYKGIQPITEINSIQINHNKIGKITTKLMDLYAKAINSTHID